MKKSPSKDNPYLNFCLAYYLTLNLQVTEEIQFLKNLLSEIFFGSLVIGYYLRRFLKKSQNNTFKTKKMTMNFPTILKSNGNSLNIEFGSLQ